MHEDRKALTCT